jgi:hypothetical protein
MRADSQLRNLAAQQLQLRLPRPPHQKTPLQRLVADSQYLHKLLEARRQKE